MTGGGSNSDVSPSIERHCKEYESQRRAGEQPRIKSYLSKVESDFREPLFRKLIKIEVDFARENGVEFPLDDLMSSFPNYSGIIQEAATQSPLDSDETLLVDVHAKPSSDKLNDTAEAIANFGRYQLVKELGSGAMGVVYQAFDRNMQRQVALKLPKLDQNSGTDEKIARFYREARTAGSLDNPNICTVYDVGEYEGQHFIAMAYVDGKSLREVMDSDEELSVERIVEIVAKLARALHQAHLNGIIHRDIKPANVMIAPNGEPILMDFGIARWNAESLESQLTEPGHFIGSPGFMAPEQVDPSFGSVAPTTDIYGLGCLLFLMLTDRLPFHSENISSLFYQILRQNPPRVSSLEIEVPPALDDLCLKMLKKPQDQRPQSMLEVADELDQLFAPEPVELATSRRGFLWAIPVVIACLVFVVYQSIPKPLKKWLPEIPNVEVQGLGEPVAFGQVGLFPILQLKVGERDDIRFILIERAEPFYLMENVVDNELYGQFAESEKVSDLWREGALGKGDQPIGIEGDQARLPVVNVAPREASRFARWIAGAYGDLPSDDEWLYAFGCTSDDDGSESNAVAESNVDLAIDREQGPVPVGTAKDDVNEFGLRDMKGNVREWTRTTNRTNVSVTPDLVDDINVVVFYLGKSYADVVPYSCGQEIEFTFHDAWDPRIGFRVLLRPELNPSE